MRKILIFAAFLFPWLVLLVFLLLGRDEADFKRMSTNLQDLAVRFKIISDPEQSRKEELRELIATLKKENDAFEKRLKEVRNGVQVGPGQLQK